MQSSPATTVRIEEQAKLAREHSLEREVGTERVGALDGDRRLRAAGLGTEVEGYLGAHLKRVGAMALRDANVTVYEWVDDADLRILAAGGTRNVPNGPDGSPFRLARVFTGGADDDLIADLPVDAPNHGEHARTRQGRFAQSRPHLANRRVAIQLKSAVDVKNAALEAAAVRALSQLIAHQVKLEHAFEVIHRRASNYLATGLDVDADRAQVDDRVGSVLDVEHAPHDERVQLHVEVDVEHNRTACLNGHVALEAGPHEECVVLGSAEVNALSMPRVHLGPHR